MSAPVLPALVGRGDRLVVEVTGDDRQSYLDDVLSQRLRDVTPPTATSALELGPHAVLADRVVVLLASGPGAAVAERLAGRTFLADATFTTRDDLEVLRVRGDADEVLGDLGVPGDHGAVVQRDDGLWLRWDHGADVVGTPDELADASVALVAAGATRADEATLDAAEVATGVPRAPEEITKGRLPEELGLLPTHVHLDKGCYPGQEAVARMWMLGRPRRRLVVAALPDGLGPGVVEDAAGPLEVTRTAVVDGRTVGLALAGRDVEVGDRPHDGVEVLAVVGAERPVPGHDPAVRRRRDR
jgi:folate-binding protein YgfZ